MVFDLLSALGGNIRAAGGVQPNEPVINAVFRGQDVQRQRAAQEQLAQQLGMPNIGAIPPQQQLDAFQQLRIQEQERALRDALRQSMAGGTVLSPTAQRPTAGQPTAPAAQARPPMSSLQQQVLQSGALETAFPRAAPFARAQGDLARMQLQEQEDIREEQRQPELEARKTEAKEKTKLLIKKRDTLPKAAAAVEAILSKLQVMEETLSDVDSQITPITTGLPGEALGLMPGTPSSNLRANLDTLQAITGFQELNDLKSVSNTGASGLGQLTEREFDNLAKLRGNIDPSQSEVQLRRNIDRYKRASRAAAKRIRRTFEKDYRQVLPEGFELTPAKELAIQPVDTLTEDERKRQRLQELREKARQ